jgi:uncharacterized metal-binding protein
MLKIRKSSSSAPVRILRLDLVLCRLACTGPAASDMHSGRRADTVGSQFPLAGKGAMLTCRAVASARTVAAHAVAHLQQIIITLSSCARCCDVTTRRPPARAAW